MSDKSKTIVHKKFTFSQAFTFHEAIEMIIDGKRVRNLDWPEGLSAFLYNKEDGIIVQKDNNGIVHSWSITLMDIKGANYVEV